MDHVRVVEVGPRDGLQNEKSLIPLATRIELIERLAGTGLLDIECGAFVSPKWVPQMDKSDQILKHLLKYPPKGNISCSFLVPNLQGLEKALSVSAVRPSSTNSSLSPFNVIEPKRALFDDNKQSKQLEEISIFAAATESFSQNNTNCSIQQSLDRFIPVFLLAKSHNIRVRAYLSVVLGCPYEGPNVSAKRVAELSIKLLEMGAYEISLGDTTGMGTVTRTRELLHTLSAAGIPSQRLAFHFHDTYAQALPNTFVALEHGIRTFDSSVAGLGGCPYAQGATGNVATEDLVYFLNSLGIKTGVDLEKLAIVGEWISAQLGRPNGSRVGKAMLAKNLVHSSIGSKPSVHL
ncbi:MAG: hypothetical protein M1829_006793 [Trizodia sp. TS-e1964]|nr:MAG: hypothetical protein M1829_006793 [Trizodia sp. TS-e1964]